MVVPAFAATTTHTSTTLTTGTTAQLYEAIKALEITARGMSDEFRREASSQLHAFYHEALRAPTLRLKNIYPVHLDLTRDRTEIPSEIEVRALGDVVGVEMGEEVQKARLQAIGSADADTLARPEPSGFWAAAANGAGHHSRTLERCERRGADD